MTKPILLVFLKALRFILAVSMSTDMYATMSLAEHLQPQNGFLCCRSWYPATTRSNCPFNTSSSVCAVLENENLWKKFQSLGTEMIITKLGRRLFPMLKVKFRGLNPDSKYWIWVDVLPLDSLRYKFVHGDTTWVAVAGAEPHTPSRHIHCEKPIYGKELMKDSVAFQNLKLTNQKDMKINNQIILNSMHKYLPRIHVSPVDAPDCTLTFTFPETAFVAVTAYQNKNIVRLKIDNNPYAKGFRDSKDHFELKGRKRSVEDDGSDEKMEEHKSKKTSEVTPWRKPQEIVCSSSPYSYWRPHSVLPFPPRPWQPWCQEPLPQPRIVSLPFTQPCTWPYYCDAYSRSYF